MKTKVILVLASTILALRWASAEEKIVIRFGHFPNITHAQGVIAHALSRQGKGLVRGATRTKGGDPVVYLQRRTIGDGSDVRRLA